MAVSTTINNMMRDKVLAATLDPIMDIIQNNFDLATSFPNIPIKEELVLLGDDVCPAVTNYAV